MKKFLKAFVAEILALLARGVIARYKPRIVMITGSVGKTSTKDAVAAALSSRFYLRKSEKSYNSDFGVPLTIFGVENPWNNITAWLSMFKHAFGLLLLPNHYPKLLVLEVGADKPRDLEKILRIATPDAVVVTRLPEVPVHVEAYASPEAVREEEFSPAYYLPPGAPLIVSSEDEYALEMAARIPAHVLTYGLADDSFVRVSNVDFMSEAGKVAGMRASVESGEQKGEVVAKEAIGRQQVLPLAAALATALALGVSFAEALKGLDTYEPPPSRGRLLQGKNGSLLIDDTYNSSPAAVEEALATLKDFPGARRRIAVLGDMLELGRYSVAEHERIGALAAVSADVVVAIGIRARGLAEAARKRLPESSVLSFDDSPTAATALSQFVQPGDVVLIKGSQSVRTERIVAPLLANPSDTTQLVRQDSEWQKR